MKKKDLIIMILHKNYLYFISPKSSGLRSPDLTSILGWD